MKSSNQTLTFLLSVCVLTGIILWSTTRKEGDSKLPNRTGEEDGEESVLIPACDGKQTTCGSVLTDGTHPTVVRGWRMNKPFPNCIYLWGLRSPLCPLDIAVISAE